MQKFCESEYWKKGRIVRGFSEMEIAPVSKASSSYRNQLLMRVLKNY
jgi:hypothetical protein